MTAAAFVRSFDAATIARAVRDARETAGFAVGADFQLAKGHDDNARRAVVTGVELAAVALAHALQLAPNSDARKAFLMACGVNDPAKN